MTTFERAFTVLNALMQRGVKHMLLSPGSRNASLMLALSHFPEINVVLQPDERSAAYTAMGLAQATQTPVVVCCTSGTAAANYFPAVVEAHYMRTPLVLLTADRPSDAVDQRRGQTIRQPNLYGDYPLSTICFSDDTLDDKLLLQIATCPNDGPTHINLPLSEPLYDTSEVQRKALSVPPPNDICVPSPPPEATSLMGKSARILLLIGQMEPNESLLTELEQWQNKGVLMAAEATANVPSDMAIQHLDTWCRNPEFTPDLVVSVGRDWVSKVIKNRFTCPIIHIEDISNAPHAYGNVSVHFRIDPVMGLATLRPQIPPQQTEFVRRWQQADAARQEDLRTRTLPWSDFTAIRHCMQHITDDAFLHLGNSSAVRYGLLSPRGKYPIYSNRGTAGIDGSLSAAMGQTIGLNRHGWCILGDVSFFYDHNAMWLKHPRCTPVVINNGGGHIFQLIDGPNRQPHIAEWQQSPTTMSIEHIARAFGYVHHRVEDEAGLVAAMQAARESSEPSVIEVVTDAEVSVGVWGELRGED
jgi:2-succinyl-5-enolpyruvyl-6-hydroxy-3-cyclohexene-1-carboxylate synthase